MRRAILTIGGTAAGLAALFSFKTHSLAGTAALGAPASPGTSTAAPMGGNGSMMTTAPSGMGKSKSKKTGMGSGSGMGSGTGKKTSTGMTAKRTLTGAVENTQYGPMQVQVTLTGTKITEVTVLQHTNDGEESAQIDSTALPKLTAEALAAQSARIDAVSGASYTSSGYIQSLQSALDKA
jgi:uncharacterized protein with FMN-binding domain